MNVPNETLLGALVGPVDHLGIAVESLEEGKAFYGETLRPAAPLRGGGPDRAGPGRRLRRRGAAHRAARVHRPRRPDREVRRQARPGPPPRLLLGARHPPHARAARRRRASSRSARRRAPARAAARSPSSTPRMRGGILVELSQPPFGGRHLAVPAGKEDLTMARTTPASRSCASRREQTLLGGGPAAIERQHERGQAHRPRAHRPARRPGHLRGARSLQDPPLPRLRHGQEDRRRRRRRHRLGPRSTAA